MADVFQLPHIAGPAETPERAIGFLGQTLGLHAELAGAALQEMARQQRHVLDPLAQGRQTQPDHIEAMKEVFAEQSLADPILEILMGGGDDPDIGAHRLMTAHPVVLAIGEHPQQAGLQVLRHVADLVQEQRAALGLFETAAPQLLGTGERAALMAEQLRLEQIARNGGGVQRHEGLAGARAVVVQRPCHQFLA